MQLEFKQLKINKIQAPNFIMSPAELKDFIDFEVKRVYFISQPTGPTGQHCHLKEKELFIMIAGSSTAIIDRGNGKKRFAWNRRRMRFILATMFGMVLKNFLQTRYCLRFLQQTITLTAKITLRITKNTDKHWPRWPKASHKFLRLPCSQTWLFFGVFPQN